jgi:hypothetical protein
MEVGKLSDYPDHPEPTFPAGEYEREEKPRFSNGMIAFWGSIVLVLIMVPPLLPYLLRLLGFN